MMALFSRNNHVPDRKPIFTETDVAKTLTELRDLTRDAKENMSRLSELVEGMHTVDAPGKRDKT